MQNQFSDSCPDFFAMPFVLQYYSDNLESQAAGGVDSLQNLNMISSQSIHMKPHFYSSGRMAAHSLEP